MLTNLTEGTSEDGYCLDSRTAGGYANITYQPRNISMPSGKSDRLTSSF